MFNQLWEPVQPRNTPVENPRWFSHCNRRDTVVIKRGLLKQIGPYEINFSHLINLTKSATNSNVEMKWFDTTEIKVHHALASLLSTYTQYEKVCSFDKSCCSSTVHATWVFARCLSYQQANTKSAPAEFWQHLHSSFPNDYCLLLYKQKIIPQKSADYHPGSLLKTAKKNLQMQFESADQACCQGDTHGSPLPTSKSP